MQPLCLVQMLKDNRRSFTADVTKARHCIITAPFYHEIDYLGCSPLSELADQIDLAANVMHQFCQTERVAYDQTIHP